MAIIAKVLSSNHFKYSRLSQSFAADISSLPDFGFVYDDAADWGFFMESERTGVNVLFTQLYEIRNYENELEGWVFVGKNNGKTYRCIIAND